MKPSLTYHTAPELLGAILVNPPIDSLTRALAVPRYCSQVILDSLELRRNLFLNPAPAAEFVEIDGRQLLERTATRLHIMNTPNQSNHMVVTAHPLLRLLSSNFASCAHSCQSFPSGATHGILDGTIEKVPACTLIFQPPPLRVRVFYRGHDFLLEREGGVTFGDVIEGLWDLQIRCEKKVDKIVKRACTPWNRYRYARAMEALGGSPNPCSWCGPNRERHIPKSEPCVFLAAEGAISEDSQHVWMARRGMTFAGW